MPPSRAEKRLSGSIDKETRVLVRAPVVDSVLLRWVCVTSCDDDEMRWRGSWAGDADLDEHREVQAECYY